MKKKRKKTKKNKRVLIKKKPKKRSVKKNKKKKFKKYKNFPKIKKIYKDKTKNNLLLKVIRFQEKLKPSLKFKIDIFYIDRAIQSFFEKIDNKIQEFKKLRFEEKQRLKIEEFEKQEREKQLANS